MPKDSRFFYYFGGFFAKEILKKLGWLVSCSYGPTKQWKNTDPYMSPSIQEWTK